GVFSGANQPLGTTAGGVSFGRDAVQVINRNNATGGMTFGFNSVNADTEIDIEPTTTAADMFAYLNTIPDITDNIDPATGVIGGDGGPFPVTFSGGLGGTVLGLMTVTPTIAGAVTPTISTTTAGIAAAGTLELNAGTTLPGTTVNGSTVMSGLPSTINIPVGTTVTGAGMAANTTVSAILSPTTVLLSAAATTSNTGSSYTFAGVTTGEVSILPGAVGVGARGVITATGTGTATISNVLGPFANSATVGVDSGATLNLSN